MKTIVLLTALIATVSAGYSQTCSKNNAVFKSEHYGAPKEVSTFGSNPEFPFLGNLNSPQQVAAAMKRSSNKKGMTELNTLLMDIGFSNGVKDVSADNITAYYIPSGTMGNMGDGNYNASYVKLEGDGPGVKSWKVSAPGGCDLYFLAKCGNAFYPTTTKTTACVSVPVNLTGASKEITLTGNGTTTSTQKVYVYYERRKKRKNVLGPEFADMKDDHASYPVLINTTNKVEGIPQTYKVTVTTPDNNVKVCEDQPLDLTANINVEKSSSYTGYYANKGVKKYKLVSRREYKKIARKMRKADRKETKVARLSGLEVNTDIALSK